MEIIRVNLTMAPNVGRKSDGEDLNNKARKKHQGEQVKERRDKDYYDFIRLYDGMARYRKRQCRYLSLGKNTTVQRVIEMSIKAFQLPFYYIIDFFLVEIYERDNYEKQLKETEPFKKQLYFDVRRPQVILKMKSKNIDREEIGCL